LSVTFHCSSAAFLGLPASHCESSFDTNGVLVN
jgi:hypothetical protein